MRGLDGVINAGKHLAESIMINKLPAPSLSNKIAANIVRKLNDEGAQPGLHLVKQTFAEEFSVSRSPVETALELLAAQGIVEKLPRRGYFLKADVDGLQYWLKNNAPVEQVKSLPFILLYDYLNKRLPSEFSEKELARQYHLTKGQVASTLRELLQEGWIERKQGYGWAFLPVVTSLHTNSQSYRFRQTIECAAILDEEFCADEVVLRQLREEQERLLDGMLYQIDNATLFQIGSRFHESIAACCRNPFYYDALARVNKLRRLYEKNSTISASNFVNFCQEHLQILDFLDQGERVAAAELMRKHLGNVISMKQSKMMETTLTKEDEELKILLHF